MPDEFAEPTELERDVLGLCSQWQDDLGLLVAASAEPDGIGGQDIITYWVKPQYGEIEYIPGQRRDASTDTWRAWIEAEYAPSFY